MKVIELDQAHPSVEDIVGLAKDQLAVLRKADGSVYAVSQVDDFDVEVELLKNNPEFMAYMREHSAEKAVISSKELRKELGLRRKKNAK